MKRIASSVLLVLILASCSPFLINTDNYADSPRLSLADAWAIVESYSQISDMENYGVMDYWASPRETMERESGDCEDLAIVLVYLLGPDARFVAIKEGSTGHAIVYYNGQYISAQWADQYYDAARIEIVYELSYWKIMAYATKAGTKHL